MSISHVISEISCHRLQDKTGLYRAILFCGQGKDMGVYNSLINISHSIRYSRRQPYRMLNDDVHTHPMPLHLLSLNPFIYV